MSRIRGRDTKPELCVRKLIRGLGFGYRLHAKDLPGRPDIVFRGRRKAVFVHGCYWHRHDGCSRATSPTTNPEFWAAKFAANVRRDGAVRDALRSSGWKTLTVWECETGDLQRTRERLRTFLETEEPVGRSASAPAGPL